MFFAVCKMLLLDEWSIKIAAWLVIIFWIFNLNFISLVFNGVIFYNRINFASTNRNVMFLFTSKDFSCNIFFLAKTSATM